MRDNNHACALLQHDSTWRELRPDGRTCNHCRAVTFIDMHAVQ
jgi:hypothetical protein